MIDRLKRLAAVGCLAAGAWAGLVFAQQRGQSPSSEPMQRPQYVQRTFRITIDPEDVECAEVMQAGYQDAAPTAPSKTMPAHPMPPSVRTADIVQSQPHVQPIASSPTIQYIDSASCNCCVGKVKSKKQCGDCCECGRSGHRFSIGGKSKCGDCECGCSSGSIVCQEQVECSTCGDEDACGKCRRKLFGHSICGHCGTDCRIKRVHFGHKSKCNDCGDDCAQKEPKRFSSGANGKKNECCNPDGSICDNVCNDKGCQRDPCPCPSNEVLTYYRCGHYGHYPTFWRAWPTGWLAYRPPVGETIYDRFRKPQRGPAGAEEGPQDPSVPESDPDLLDRMRARQGRTNTLGEQVPEEMQPRRRPVPERVPDLDIPDRPSAPGKAAPKEKTDGGTSLRWIRPQP